jgi:hypothetical protein
MEDTACIHNKVRGKWYVFDDSRVSPCDDNSVVVTTRLNHANLRAVPVIFYGIREIISFKLRSNRADLHCDLVIPRYPRLIDFWDSRAKCVIYTEEKPHN